MYQLFTRRRDALFDLTDALLTTGSLLSPAHLSLVVSFQRGWGSVYDALVDGQIDGKAIETLLCQHPLEAGEPIYDVNASVWARCNAEISPERTFYHHPSRHSARQPIVAGWAYHWIAQINFTHTSWTAPRKVRRLKPSDNVSLAAVEQIKERLQDSAEGAPLPIFVFDAGYEPGQLAQAWGSLRAAAPRACAQDAAFMPIPAIRHPLVDPHGMGTSSPALTRAPGSNQIRSISPRTASMDMSMCVPGQPACHSSEPLQARHSWPSSAHVGHTDPR